MKRFEYKTISDKNEYVDLGLFGDTGWELVTVVSNADDDRTYFFKRELL